MVDHAMVTYKGFHLSWWDTEQKTDTRMDNREAMLLHATKNGWELVSVTGDGPGAGFYFKRAAPHS